MAESATLPTPAPFVFSMSDVEKAIQKDAGISLDDMPASFTATGEMDMPLVSNEKRAFPLPKGRKDVRCPTIKDVNGPPLDADGFPKLNADKTPVPGRFDYAWLSPEDKAKPEFEGWRIVRDDNEGSKGPDGEEILPHYFVDHVIRRGSCTLNFCKWTYSYGHKEKYRQVARLRARSLGASGDAQTTDFSGNPVDVKLGSPDDNNRSARGRK